MLATVTGAWLLAGEVFGPRRLLQLVTAAVAGLQPMVGFISTSVNPDALLIALWTFGLWLGARAIRRRAPGRDVIALCGVTAAAILTKETAYGLLPAIVVALAIGWRRRPANARGRAVRPLLAGALTLAVPVVAWIIVIRSTGRTALTIAPPTASASRHPVALLSGFTDYLWQFYLPRLPGQVPFPVPALAVLPWPRQPPGPPVWNLWIREGWGVFGWIDVYLPGWVYAALAAVTGTIMVAAGRILSGVRQRADVAVLGFLAVAAASLLAVVHVVEYETLSGGNGPTTQGRYALPLISLFGLATALVVSRLPRRAQGAAVAVVIVGLLGLDVLALGTVAGSYYT